MTRDEKLSDDLSPMEMKQNFNKSTDRAITNYIIDTLIHGTMYTLIPKKWKWIYSNKIFFYTFL